MKKVLFFTVLIILYSNLWSKEFSIGAGVGGLVGGLFTRYTLDINGVIGGDPVNGKIWQNINQFNYGGLVFFDATYGELSVILQNGNNNWEETINIEGSEGVSPGDGWETMLGFSLLGKYPFRFGEKFTIFPLLGVEYHISLRQRRTNVAGYPYDRTNGIIETDLNGNAYKLSTWNSLFVDVGCGADFAFNEKIFIRGELLYHFRLMTPYEKDGLEQAKRGFNDDDPGKKGLTSGPSLRLSAGYKFWNR